MPHLGELTGEENLFELGKVVTCVDDIIVMNS